MHAAKMALKLFIAVSSNIGTKSSLLKPTRCCRTLKAVEQNILHRTFYSQSAENVEPTSTARKRPPMELEANLGKIVDLSFEEEREKKKTKADAGSKANFTKIEGKSSVLTNFMVNVKSKRKREESGTILLEGKRLIQDAVDAGEQPLALFFSRVGDVANFKLDPSVQLYRVPYKKLQFWSDTDTTQGVLGVFKTPDTSKMESSASLPLTVVCDNVRDPGNMGSILRTCAAVGCSQLLLTKGCVDLWEPKVLRTAAGAHFRLQIYQSLTWEDVADLTPVQSSVFLADSDVPEKEAEESLLDVYELSSSGEKVPVSDEPSKRLTAYQKTKSDDSRLSVYPYTEPDYGSCKALVLVVGGETTGLSDQAFDLAADRQGARVFVPLENGVESLNSGTALGVLAYEIRRQRLFKT